MAKSSHRPSVGEGAAAHAAVPSHPPTISTIPQPSRARDMASAHAMGQTFCASKVWWCVDGSAPRLPRKTYLNLVAARKAIYAALSTLNCELFVRNAAPPASPPAAATKSDLRAAVKTILRGEDVNVAKPGPRLTPAKRRQIKAAEAWRASHAGCSLHKACIRSFVSIEDGYRSAKALYVVLSRKGNN